jgi:hypothetical protein
MALRTSPLSEIPTIRHQQRSDEIHRCDLTTACAVVGLNIKAIGQMPMRGSSSVCGAANYEKDKAPWRLLAAMAKCPTTRA